LSIPKVSIDTNGRSEEGAPMAAKKKTKKPAAKKKTTKKKGKGK
jgi:hypothetical protein